MNIYLALFLIIPITLVIAKELNRIQIPMWLIFLFYVPIGWFLIYVAVQAHFSSLDVLLMNSPNPSEQLLRNWENDGAVQVFTYYLGWLHSSVYFLLSFLAVKTVAAIVRKLR
jgi:hypothetical protein